MSYYETEVVKTMPDYKELYLSLFRATERAISALIEAQRAAEEAFINSTDTMTTRETNEKDSSSLRTSE